MKAPSTAAAFDRKQNTNPLNPLDLLEAAFDFLARLFGQRVLHAPI
jgi:hypothetical protein